jgi:predicted amidophosphoribosyltransferase
MKCKDCRNKLDLYYYLIGGRTLCKRCSLELISDIKEFKVKIEKGSSK